jgi:hypothetical protein
MGLFRKNKISIPRQDPQQVAQQAAQAAQALAQQQGQLFQTGVTQAGDLASTAATRALDINIGAMPRIREAQQQFNPELFSAIAEQERLATGDLATRLEEEASQRLGTGLTFDEERALRESSRGAFTSRGMFRSNPALLDEIVRRQQADRQARMQNAQFAAGVLGTRQSLFQTPLMHRQQLFLDPRSATGITPGSLMSAGIGLGGGALQAGLGVAKSAAESNLQAAQAEAVANRRGGMLGNVLKGIGQAGISFLGAGGANNLFRGGGGSTAPAVAQPAIPTRPGMGVGLFGTGIGANVGMQMALLDSQKG